MIDEEDKAVHNQEGTSFSIRYWLIGKGAQFPERNKGAALDLKARLRSKYKLVWGWAKIPTGVALEMPDNAVIRVTGRSGNFMRGLIVHDGLVESEFNGQELCALIYCPWPRIIRQGQRIAQMWALSIDRQVFEQLDQEPTGVFSTKAGFGSTGG